ncbi:MAG: PspC domain-containing protein [Pseudomonadota bacterium]
MNRNDPNKRSSSERNSDSEFTQAMNRLENAVQDLVSVTTGQLGDRATKLIDETSKRLEAELRLKKATEDDPDGEVRQERRERRLRHRHDFEDQGSSGGRLTIDRENEKIAGVCAGLAPYLGVEIWMVRLAAVTGMLFIPHIVFPAYWIAYFVMEKPDKRSRRQGRRGRRTERKERAAQARQARRDEFASRFRQSDPEPEFNPRQSLRYTRTDLTQAELRLRRLESFVTSDQYELQKELHRIERA